MSDETGRHGAHDGSTPAVEAGDPDAAYRRPPGLSEPFEARPAPEPYSPPPPTVSPEDRTAFGRPDGAAAFAAPVGERISPQRTLVPTVPYVMTSAFGAPPDAEDGFAPARRQPHRAVRRRAGVAVVEARRRARPVA